MQLKSISILAALILLTCAGCTDRNAEKVGEFAKRFGQFVSRNETDSVLKYYPQAEYADKIDLAFKSDSIKVSNSDAENSYTIDFGQHQSMLVNLLSDGNIKVVETKGLFIYPKEKLKFAQEVGALHSDMTDEKLAKAMIIVDNISSELFNDFVTSRKNAIKNLGSTVTKDVMYGYEYGEGYYTLKNTTDHTIGGEEYSITWQNDYMHMGYETHSQNIEPGKDIPPHGSIRIPFNFSLHGGSTIKAITMHTPNQETFFKNYTPKGDEYAVYVRVHGDDPGKVTRLSYGPYSLAGKLGGKYPIHLTIDQGMKHGSYYYDKYGPKNKLTINVKAFNDRTGELILEEINDNGEMTGTFTGILSPEGYNGTMSSFEGKKYNFSLKTL